MIQLRIDPAARAVTLLVTAMSIPAFAQTSVEACRAISDPQQRLACFDAASGGATEPLAPVATPSLAAPAPQEPPNVQVAPKAPVAPPGPAVQSVVTTRPPTPPPGPPAQTTFGAESLPPQANAAKKIQAQVLGTFRGWERGTELKLDNGQVWVVVDVQTPYFTRRESPEISIRKVSAGSYLAKVEGSNRIAQVRRVK